MAALPKKPNQLPIIILNVLAKLKAEHGIFGLAILVLLYLIVFKSTDAQKQEIIDRYILFKDFEHEPIYVIIVFVSLVIIILYSSVTHSRTIKLKDQQIAELTKERDKYLNKLLTNKNYKS